MQRIYRLSSLSIYTKQTVFIVCSNKNNFRFFYDNKRQIKTFRNTYLLIALFKQGKSPILLGNKEEIRGIQQSMKTQIDENGGD